MKERKHTLAVWQESLVTKPSTLANPVHGRLVENARNNGKYGNLRAHANNRFCPLSLGFLQVIDAMVAIKHNRAGGDAVSSSESAADLPNVGVRIDGVVNEHGQQCRN